MNQNSIHVIARVGSITTPIVTPSHSTCCLITPLNKQTNRKKDKQTHTHLSMKEFKQICWALHFVSVFTVLFGENVLSLRTRLELLVDARIYSATHAALCACACTTGPTIILSAQRTNQRTANNHIHTSSGSSHIWPEFKQIKIWRSSRLLTYAIENSLISDQNWSAFQWILTSSGLLDWFP